MPSSTMASLFPTFWLVTLSKTREPVESNVMETYGSLYCVSKATLASESASPPRSISFFTRNNDFSVAPVSLSFRVWSCRIERRAHAYGLGVH